MKITKFDRGQALIMVLFFTLIALLMILAVLYLVLRGTDVSGMQKRYQTSIDAAYAGVSVQTRFLKQGSYNITDPILQQAFGDQTFNVNPVPLTCLYEKLYFSYDTALTRWPHCTAADISVDASESPDSTLRVTGQNAVYYVDQKIVDSRRGLTAERPPGVELPTGVAYGSETGLDLTPQAYFYYAVEVKTSIHTRFTSASLGGEKVRDEVARISFDYAW